MLNRLLPFGAAFVLGSIATAKVRGNRDRWRSERTDKLPESPFVPKPLVEVGYTFATRLGRAAARLGVTANQCTAISILIGLGAAVVIASGHLVIGGCLLFAGSSFDTLDGIIARATGTASDAGEFFDATADRINDTAAFLGLAWYYRGDLLGFALVCVALVGSLLVSYIRAKGESFGVDCAVGWMQRHERILWLVGGLIAGPLVANALEPDIDNPKCHVLLAVLAVVGLFSLVTAAQRSRIIYRTLVERQRPSH